MFHKESLCTHRQLFILCGIEVIDFSTTKGMTIEEIHIYQNSQSMAVGLNARQFFIWIAELQRTGLKNLRSNKVRCAYNIRRIFAGNNKTVTVDNCRFTT